MLFASRKWKKMYSLCIFKSFAQMSCTTKYWDAGHAQICSLIINKLKYACVHKKGKSLSKYPNVPLNMGM